MWWLWAVAQGASDRSGSNLRVEVEWKKAWGGLERGLESFGFSCWSSLYIWISQGLCLLFPKF